MSFHSLLSGPAQIERWTGRTCSILASWLSYLAKNSQVRGERTGDLKTNVYHIEIIDDYMNVFRGVVSRLRMDRS